MISGGKEGEGRGRREQQEESNNFFVCPVVPHHPDFVQLVKDALDSREQWLSCQHFNKYTSNSPVRVCVCVGVCVYM